MKKALFAGIMALAMASGPALAGPDPIQINIGDPLLSLSVPLNTPLTCEQHMTAMKETNDQFQSIEGIAPINSFITFLNAWGERTDCGADAGNQIRTMFLKDKANDLTQEKYCYNVTSSAAQFRSPMATFRFGQEMSKAMADFFEAAAKAARCSADAK